MSISSIPLRTATPPQSESMREIPSVPHIIPITSSAATQPSLMTLNDLASKVDAADTAYKDTFYKNPSPAEVKHAVHVTNDAFAMRGQNLYASLERDKETGIEVVKLIDKNTQEVISQIPSKEIVDVAASITQYQENRGHLLNVKA